MITIKENTLIKPLTELLRYIEKNLEDHSPDQRPIDISAYTDAVIALRAIGIEHKYISKIIDCYVEVQCQERESDGKDFDGFYHVEVTTRKKSDPDLLSKSEKCEVYAAVLDAFHYAISIADVETFQFAVLLSNGMSTQGFADPSQNPERFVSSAEMISTAKVQLGELPFRR